ncbi:MAG: hypothetical protein GY930_05100 [bacterium]|nr:hypothetical protein [bacterium]
MPSPPPLTYADLPNTEEALQVELLKQQILATDKSRRPGLAARIGIWLPIVTTIATSALAATQYALKEMERGERVGAERAKDVAIQAEESATRAKVVAQKAESEAKGKVIKLAGALEEEEKAHTATRAEIDKFSTMVGKLNTEIAFSQKEFERVMGLPNGGGAAKWGNLQGQLKLTAEQALITNHAITDYVERERRIITTLPPEITPGRANFPE